MKMYIILMDNLESIVSRHNLLEGAVDGEMVKEIVCCVDDKGNLIDACGNMINGACEGEYQDH